MKWERPLSPRTNQKKVFEENGHFEGLATIQERENLLKRLDELDSKISQMKDKSSLA